MTPSDVDLLIKRFEQPEPGHDSWVVGDEPYVSLHFLGAEQYASN